MFCPNCHSDNVKVESVQENIGSTAITETKHRLNVKKKHGNEPEFVQTVEEKLCHQTTTSCRIVRKAAYSSS